MNNLRLGERIELLKKIVSGIMLTLLLVGMFTLAFNIQPAVADGNIHIRANGAIDPPTAPISTLDNVTYTLTGNISSPSKTAIYIERDNIILDGAGYTLDGRFRYQYSYGIYSHGTKNVTVQNIQITAFGYGMWLWSISNFNINGNNITANRDDGIELLGGSNNSISRNNIKDNIAGQGIWASSSYNGSISANNMSNGIWLGHSSSNSIIGNNIANRVWLYNISDSTICGNTLTNGGLVVTYSYSNSVENNTVNGKPLVYLEGVSDYSVGIAGQVILVNCDRIRVENLNLSKTTIGMQLWKTNNSIISWNNITNDGDGIDLHSSYNNTMSWNNISINGDGFRFDSSSNNSITGNNIANNNVGIWLSSSSNNSIYHNNFINNQVYDYHWTGPYIPLSINAWDDGYPSGGNYWSDYLTKYPNATEIDHTGIGDTPYVTYENNTDNYPLMNPYFPPDVAVMNVTLSRNIVGRGYSLDINITVTNQGSKIQGFNVTVYANTAVIWKQTIILTSENSTTITFTWNTASFDKGNYTLWAYVEPIEGETNTTNNQLVYGTLVVTIPGDVDGNFEVDIYDVTAICVCYDSKPGDPNYYPNCDLDGNGIIDIYDVTTACITYGQKYP